MVTHCITGAIFQFYCQAIGLVGKSPGVSQRLDFNQSVAGLSDVSRRYQQDIINSRNGSAADGEFDVRSTEQARRLHLQHECSGLSPMDIRDAMDRTQRPSLCG